MRRVSRQARQQGGRGFCLGAGREAARSHASRNARLPEGRAARGRRRQSQTACPATEGSVEGSGARGVGTLLTLRLFAIWVVEEMTVVEVVKQT